MSDSSTKADQFVKEAEKEAKKFFGFKQDKYLKASDLYTRAGNLYKIDREFVKAGDSYLQASKYLEKAGSHSSAVDKSREATICYFKCPNEKEKVKESLDYTESLISNSSDPYKTATMIVNGAELFKKEGEKELAIETYDRALAILKTIPDCEATMAGIIEEKAYLVGDSDLISSSEYFLEAGQMRMKKQQTQGLASRLFINAVFTRIASLDYVGAEMMWDKVVAANPAIKFSMSGQIVDKLVKSAVNTPQDVPDILKEYKRVNVIDLFTQELFRRMGFDDSEEQPQQEQPSDEAELL